MAEPTGPQTRSHGAERPGRVGQDTWRTAFFSGVKGRSAFLNDLVWAIAQAVLIAAVLLLHHRSTPAFILAWGLAANVAAVAGGIQSGIVPRPSSTGRW